MVYYNLLSVFCFPFHTMLFNIISLVFRSLVVEKYITILLRPDLHCLKVYSFTIVVFTLKVVKMFSVLLSIDFTPFTRYFTFRFVLFGTYTFLPLVLTRTCSFEFVTVQSGMNFHLTSRVQSSFKQVRF